jgi:hypothetical protein
MARRHPDIWPLVEENVANGGQPNESSRINIAAVN